MRAGKHTGFWAPRELDNFVYIGDSKCVDIKWRYTWMYREHTGYPWYVI